MVKMLLYRGFHLNIKALARKGDMEDHIGKALKAFSKEEFGLLLEYIREWNTKPKFCHIGQFVLSRVYSILPATEIIKVPLCFPLSY